MDLFHVIILSIIEGITEFLPISSTGHLILTSKVLALENTEFLKTFEIAIQSGAILSVVVLYWRKLLSDRELLKKVFVAFLPTAVVGYLLYKVVKVFLLGNSTVVLWSFFLGGIGLIAVELLFKQKNVIASKAWRSHRLLRHFIPRNDKTEKLSYKRAFLIGVIQSISIIPGVSRAAATIIGGMFMGLSRTGATEFSFMLAIPTMGAATGLDLLKSASLLTQSNLFYLAIGFMISFLVALVAIKWLLKFIQTNTFIPFGIYRILLALLFFLFVK